ncbi:MAG: TolC family protein, partial [Candidatus Eremiobacteraeota bacterium]|nr:TolC family protein [Candidatus Eremiobacteraeota bacterium]
MRTLVALVAAAMVVEAATPAQAATLTLAEAVDFALVHNQSVLQAQSLVSSAAAALARNRSLELPLVQGQALSQLNRQSSNNAGSFAQFGLRPSPNFSQNTTQLLASENLFNFSNTLQAKEARHGYKAALARLRLVREQVKLNVETGYYALLQNVSLADLAQRDEAYQRRLLDIAKANFRAGKVAGIDQLKAQVQLTTSQERLASQRADVQDSRENIAQLIGSPPGTNFQMDTSMPQPQPESMDIDALHAAALAQRPELAVAQANLDNAVLALGMIDAPNRPVIALNGA